jgi:hypothetical protein
MSLEPYYVNVGPRIKSTSNASSRPGFGVRATLRWREMDSNVESLHGKLAEQVEAGAAIHHIRRSRALGD